MLLDENPFFKKIKLEYLLKSFFYTILDFTQSHSGVSGDIEGFIQKIPGTNKRDKPVNTTGIAKIHLGRDCFTGSIVNGIRKPILFSFGLSSPTGHKRYKEPRIKLFKLINLFFISYHI